MYNFGRHWQANAIWNSEQFSGFLHNKSFIFQRWEYDCGNLLEKFIRTSYDITFVYIKRTLFFTITLTGMAKMINNYKAHMLQNASFNKFILNLYQYKIQE